jgi:hypothetical protein
MQILGYVEYRTEEQGTRNVEVMFQAQVFTLVLRVCLSFEIHKSLFFCSAVFFLIRESFAILFKSLKQGDAEIH